MNEGDELMFYEGLIVDIRYFGRDVSIFTLASFEHDSRIIPVYGRVSKSRLGKYVEIENKTFGDRPRMLDQKIIRNGKKLNQVDIDMPHVRRLNKQYNLLIGLKSLEASFFSWVKKGWF